MEARLRVTREAVCLADDFAGPLEMTVDLAADASLEAVVGTIARARFLQFSSSHATITAVSGGRELARVSSRGSIEYLVDPALPAGNCIADGELGFLFRRAGPD